MIKILCTLIGIVLVIVAAILLLAIGSVIRDYIRWKDRGGVVIAAMIGCGPLAMLIFGLNLIF